MLQIQLVTTTSIAMGGERFFGRLPGEDAGGGRALPAGSPASVY